MPKYQNPLSFVKWDNSEGQRAFPIHEQQQVSDERSEIYCTKNEPYYAIAILQPQPNYPFTATIQANRYLQIL